MKFLYMPFMLVWAAVFLMFSLLRLALMKSRLLLRGPRWNTAGSFGISESPIGDHLSELRGAEAALDAGDAAPAQKQLAQYNQQVEIRHVQDKVCGRFLSDVKGYVDRSFPLKARAGEDIHAFTRRAALAYFAVLQKQEPDVFAVISESGLLVESLKYDDLRDMP